MNVICLTWEDTHGEVEVDQTGGLRGNDKAEPCQTAPRHHHHPGIICIAQRCTQRACKTHTHTPPIKWRQSIKSAVNFPSRTSFALLTFLLFVSTRNTLFADSVNKDLCLKMAWWRKTTAPLSACVHRPVFQFWLQHGIHVLLCCSTSF